MSGLADLPYQPFLGAFILIYIAYAKYGEYRFRKTAVVVRGEVKKITPKKNGTIYLFGYTLDGVDRLDEYAGPPAVPMFDVGDVAEIRIDPSPPTLPDSSTRIEADPLRPTGVCFLKHSPLFGFWDLFWVLVSVALIAYPQWKKG